MGKKIGQLRPGRRGTGVGFGTDLETADSAQSVALRVDSLFTREAAVFQNSPTIRIMNHQFWTRVLEHIFSQVTENCPARFKYGRL